MSDRFGDRRRTYFLTSRRLLLYDSTRLAQLLYVQHVLERNKLGDIRFNNFLNYTNFHEIGHHRFNNTRTSNVSFRRFFSNYNCKEMEEMIESEKLFQNFFFSLEITP